MDTNNGKLYKYRAVNEYSLKNLKEGTLYCASPSSFNDPFDCRIGIDLEALLYSRYNISPEKIEKNVSVDNIWMLELADLLQKGDVSLDELKESFVRNQNAMEEWLSKLNDEPEWKDQVKIALKNSMTIYDVMSVEQIRNFFGGVMNLAEYSSVWGINEDADKTTLISKMTQLFSPEKAEEAKKLDSNVTKVDSFLVETINKIYRVGCLCVEYDFCADFDWWEKFILLPVIYSKERVQFPWDMIFMKYNEEQMLKDAMRVLMRSLITKDKIWKYENEWRIIVPSEIENIKMPPISCIYVGASCGEEDITCLSGIAQELNVPIKRMMIGREEYTLHAAEIM